MFLKAPISSRSQFPELMQNMGLTEGWAVEVGTHRGDFAEQLLRQWPLTINLFCIDPWDNPPGYEQQAKYLWGSGGTDRRADYHAALELLNPYRRRVTYVRDVSINAVKQFGDESLTFVYIDADHSLEAVYTDLQLWYPKLKRGGILAGHDWLCPGVQGTDEDWGRSIQPAVNLFLTACYRGLDVHLIVEEKGLPWSYYMVKP